MSISSPIRNSTRSTVASTIARASGGPAVPGVDNYLRPASTDKYLRPDGTSLFKRPG